MPTKKTPPTRLTSQMFLHYYHYYLKTQDFGRLPCLLRIFQCVHLLWATPTHTHTDCILKMPMPKSCDFPPPVSTTKAGASLGEGNGHIVLPGKRPNIAKPSQLFVVYLTPQRTAHLAHLMERRTSNKACLRSFRHHLIIIFTKVLHAGHLHLLTFLPSS